VTVDNESASTAELINRASQQISTLVRDELALAKVELVAKGKRAGIGGGLLGAAGVLGLYGLGLVIALLVVLLDLAVALWLAVLIVAVLVFAAAGIAAMVGRRELKAATPPVPSEATAGLAEDVQTVKTAVREGRQR
jgi:hypothetical protein